MIQILQEAAYKGGKILRSYFRKDLSTEIKTTHHNIVTKADIESQKEIQDYITHILPEKMNIKKEEIGFIGEEGLYIKGKYLFVIDPLDGTSNFSSGFDLFGVSIGLFINNKLQYGVIYQPMQDIMYFANKEKSSFKKIGNTIHRLQVKQLALKQTYFNLGFSANDDVRKMQFSLHNKLYHHFLGHISLNAAAPLLCLVADNVIGLCLSGIRLNYHVGCSIWDIAAGKLILEEAGGAIADWKGNELEFDLNDREKKYPFIACHQDNLHKILEFIK